MQHAPTSLDSNGDDAELRSAIQRVRGGHVADPALRARVARALEAGAEPTPAWRRWAPRLAVAASLLFAGGVIEHVRHKAEERRNYAAANEPLLRAMVQAHAGGVLPAPASPADPVAARNALAAELSRVVPLPDLRPIKWNLAAAAVRPLHGAIAGRFDFTSNGKRATLFSLPRFALVGAADGFTYDVVVDGHPVSGYVTADGAHCIVGDAATPPAEIAALRRHLQRL